jgi:rare lipoprotein A
MKWLALPLLAVALAGCSTAPKKSAPSGAVPPGGPATSPQGATATAPRDQKPCKTYAPAQEDLSKRGNYTAGGLYAPGVSDSTPAYVPQVECIAEPRVTDEPRSRVGNRSPYTVLGKQYRVLDSVDGYVEQGTASYYGSKFHGRRTSNQEVYDMYAFTAAHKSLPLPSFARVTNLDNGKSVVVRVNDRGPFHEGRVIDLSYAAAVKLGITQRGTGRVEVRGLTPGDTGLAATPAPSPAAAAPASAMDQLVGQLPARAAPSANRYHATASASADGARGPEGFESWMKANGVRVATGKPATLSPGAASAPATVSVATASAPVATVSSPGSLQLQVASFSSRDNADRALARLAAAGITEARLSDVASNGRVLWRLRVAVTDSASADALAGRIAGLGFGRPQIVRD